MTLSAETSLLIIQQAHRFDGYAWAAAQTGRADDHELLHGLYETFRRAFRIPAEPVAALALNFYVHRCFYHAGCRPDPGSDDWDGMVLRYLHTYRIPAAKAFRHASGKDWERRPKGSAERVAAEIRLTLARRPHR